MIEPSQSNDTGAEETHDGLAVDPHADSLSTVPEAERVNGLEKLKERRSSRRSEAKQKLDRERNWEEWQTGREKSVFLSYTTANTIGLGVIFLTTYLLFGGMLHKWVETIPNMNLGSKVNLAFFTGLLASDCILPLEHTQICSLAIEKLGRFKGFVVCLAGLSIGSVVPYFLASRFVPGVLRLKFSERVIQKRRRFVRKWGPWAIIVFRGVPVLSEMTSFYAGCYRLSWFRFLLPTVASGAGIAGFFAAFKEISMEYVFLVPVISFWAGLIGVILMLTEEYWLPILTGDVRTDVAGKKRKKRKKRRRF